MNNTFVLNLFRVSFTAIALLHVAPKLSQAAPPLVWSPSTLAVELTSGETATYTVSFAARSDLEDVRLRVVLALARFVEVTPTELPLVMQGVEEQVSITIHAPDLEEPRTFDGVLQLRQGDRLIAKPLPLVVSVQPETTPLPGIVLYGETTNPLLFSFDLDDGRTVDVQGVRDETGVATAITSIAITSPDGSEIVTLLDDQSRPAKALSSDGTVFEFQFVSETRFVLTAISADGTLQANVPIDLTALASAAGNGDAIDVTTVDPVATAQIQSILRPIEERSPDMTTVPSSMAVATTSFTTSLTNATAIADIQQCGAPVSGAFVRLNITSRLVQGSGYTLTMGEISPGRYGAGFVNFASSTPPNQILDFCLPAQNIYTDACGLISPIATAMAEGGCLALAFIGPEATLLIPACEQWAAGAVLACAPAEVGDGICGSILEVQNFFDPDGSILTLTAEHRGQSKPTNEQLRGT